MGITQGVIAPNSEEIVSSDCNFISLQRNPLLIDTVLRSLFSYLDYETLKDCRLVTKKWKVVSDPKFIKSSALALRNSATKGKPPSFSFCKSPEDVPPLFKSDNQEEHGVRISSIKVEMGVFTHSIEELFLLPNVLGITELEISGEGDLGQFAKNTDISSLSRPQLNADQFIGPNLVKLKLSNVKEPWIVSSEKLKSLRHIYLHHCHVVVNSDVKMAPQELNLLRCVLVENGKSLPVNMNLNKIVNFSSIQKLLVVRLLSQDELTRVELNWSDLSNIKDIDLCCTVINLDGKISPEKLALQGNYYKINGADVSNVLIHEYLYSSANTPIKKIMLQDNTVTFDFGSPLIIDDMEFGNIKLRGENPKANVRHLKLYDFSTNFSLLPQTMESLELVDFGGDCIHYGRADQFHLPNLKRLKLYKGCAHTLHRFKNCSALTRVLIDRFQCWADVLDLQLLFMYNSNVKTLSLKTTFDFQVGLHSTANLELLVLSFTNDSFDKMLKYYEILQMNQIIQADLVFFHQCGKANEREKYILEIVKITENYNVQNFAFGPVEWERRELFENSLFSEFTDKKAEYYVFNGRKGKGVNKTAFYGIIPNDCVIEND